MGGKAKDSPDIIDRIDRFLDTAIGFEYDGKGIVLGVNQVLVNEYGPGQGISVSTSKRRLLNITSLCQVLQVCAS